MVARSFIRTMSEACTRTAELRLVLTGGATAHLPNIYTPPSPTSLPSCFLLTPVKMSQPPQNTTLSFSARLATYLGPPSIILLTSLASPKTGLLTPLAFIPTAYAYRCYNHVSTFNPSHHAPLEPLIWTYALAGTCGLLGVGLIQIGVVKAVSFLLFYHDPAGSKIFGLSLHAPLSKD